MSCRYDFTISEKPRQNNINKTNPSALEENNSHLPIPFILVINKANENIG